MCWTGQWKSLNCERLYLSIDLDALDPAFAPAVGNPEPFGLTSWDVKRVIERDCAEGSGTGYKRADSGL